MAEALRVGVIGGGPLPLQWNREFERIDVETPFGRPSDAVARTVLAGGNIVYSLLRHGRRHGVGSEINHRANVAAMSQLGCELVASVSLCGSLSPRFDVGDTVIYDDIIDFRRTVASFHAPTSAKHIAVAPMVEDGLWDQLKTIASDAKLPFGANMVVIEGPRYSTFAESRMFASLGGDLICQTASPECFLVRETGMAWVGCSLVTDRDTRDRKQLVSTELIFANMKQFEERFAKNLLTIFERLGPWPRQRNDAKDEVPRAQLKTYEE